MSYVKRVLEITITLGEGQFGDNAGDSVTLNGLRASAVVAVAGGDAQGQLQLRVFGLPLEMMNQLTTIGPIATQVRNNSILVAAGDEGGTLTTIYQGTIWQAWADFQAMPDATLNVTAYSAANAAVKPVNASSYVGTVDVATIMQALATQMGFAFENNGVTAQLSNPYFPGTALMQVQACAKAANIKYSTELGTLAIWPKNSSRVGDTPVISTATGMVGYPSFSSQGLGVVSEFLPTVRAGGLVEVQSSLQIASGVWGVSTVLHHLESETPGGAWFTQLLLHPNVQ